LHKVIKASGGNGMRRARLTGLLAAGLTIAGVFGSPAVASTTPITQTGTVRLSGNDRYATAVAISKATFAAPVDSVFLASGEGFPDALAGGPAAARLQAPLLLTQHDQVPDVVWTELTRLAPTTVYLLGGTGAVTAAVADVLALHGYTVDRLSGVDRYATAAAVAATWPAGTSTVYLASGSSFPDALSGGAAAASDGAPVLLTGATTLPPVTRSALQTLAPDRVIVLGGTGVVSTAVASSVQALLPSATVDRYFGADRFATSAAIAKAAWPSGADTVFYASGLGFADALAGVPAAAVNGAPLLLTSSSCVTSDVATTAGTLASTRQVLLGGTGALPQGAADTTCAAKGTALAALATLAVKAAASQTGYDRDLFGPAWADVDANGCDTRNDVLRRDLTDIVIKADTKGCVVASGTLDDPYTATAISFVQGPDSSDVQIDHMVALSNAWQTGAQQWTATTRKAFANDPLNLLAVDGPTNAAKGDSDAAEWLPPNTAYQCAYVARQVAVKVKYDAWITGPEKDAISGVLNTCPEQKLPTNTAVPAPVPDATEPLPPTDVYYANCDAVRAAGAAPLYAGEPGYRAGLDRDGDGVACES
jgi:putative cell wall-binding protein